jgi:DNA-binding transcriptional LysR family regulator
MKRFLGYDHVLMSPSDGRFRGPADDALATCGARRRVALSVPNFLVLLEILQTDDLIALVPRRLLTGRPHSRRLFRPPVEVEGFDVIMAWHSRSQHDPANAWFRDTLAKVSVNAGQS